MKIQTKHFLIFKNKIQYKCSEQFLKAILLLYEFGVWWWGKQEKNNRFSGT